ncbi:hypothetical protein FHX49_001275 [Microbacterium endophyticum]|uniref:DUF2975 domain-containing protein n=1 Tax=Microbacterium endophyticum TaxID=1526412 RepID=A0A7W4V3W4_9MICO|nr:hypothetical protein [Microbacterium endophyticum]MBB2975708.1 hypothetical protein [Microbacterium endophyticum]NIK36191.1 hypothetical protein [Microbacterium endophyticum]
MLAQDDPVRTRPTVRYRVVRALLAVVAGLVVVNDLVRAFTTVTGRTLLTFGGADGRLPLSQLPQLNQADLREGAAGTLADLDFGARVFAAAPSMIEALTVMFAFFLLLRVLKGVALAAPFSAPVLSGWRRLTMVLLVGGCVQVLVETAASVYIASRMGLLFGAGQVMPEDQEAFLGGDYVIVSAALPQWPIAILIAGLVAWALASAFRAGAKLEADVDGVV